MEKTNILFLHPGPIYRPDLADVKDKYEILSQRFKGTILTWTTAKKFLDYKMVNFVLKPLLRQCGDCFTKAALALFMIRQGLFLHYKKEKFQAIICYDPLSTGIIGVILKYLLGVKLIIEINGDLLHAGFLGQLSIAKKAKYFLYKILIAFSLKNADSIKLLNNKQKNFLGNLACRKHTFIYNDFVPTHYFENTVSKSVKYILFVGHPFYLKGVDILIKAFQSISCKHPDFRLKLIGYKLEQDGRGYFNNLNAKVQFCQPRFYDKIREDFFNCYCFVLPSRTEAMGRVLLEAMSSGKPVIGARVGGIPEVIEEGKNGFLFDRENTEDLVEKLDILLSNPQLAKSMGEYGKKLVEEKFSSDKFYRYFTDMVEQTLGA